MIQTDVDYQNPAFVHSSTEDDKLYPSQNNSAKYKYIMGGADCFRCHTICRLAIYGLYVFIERPFT